MFYFTGFVLLGNNISNSVHYAREKYTLIPWTNIGPVVSSSGLSEHEVVGSEDLAERSGSDRVHGSGLQVDKDGTGHVFAAGGLIVVDVDALQLKVAVSVVCSGWVNAVLVWDDFPELMRQLRMLKELLQSSCYACHKRLLREEYETVIIVTLSC